MTVEEVKDISEVVDINEIGLIELLQRSEKIDSLCEDFTITKANNSNVRFNDNAGITYQSDLGDIRRPSLSRFSLGQLCSKIGVPAQYISKCVNNGMIDLAQDNVNSWLEDYNKNLFIREYDGKVRGVLSTKYSVCDSSEILQVIDDVIDLHKYKVKGSFMNEERLHLRLVDKTPLPINGEDLFAGITIDSSDVGRSILNCTFLIYKQVCTNGMVVSKANGTLFQQKHIGITSEEFHKGLTEGISIIPILTENAVGLINKSKSIKTTISGYSSMSKIPDDELQDFIAEIKLKTKLSEENANKVIQLMYDKYDSSKFGYLNSITDVAKDFTLERRIELEKYAGDVLVA